jgi:hypothetical protein
MDSESVATLVTGLVFLGLWLALAFGTSRIAKRKGRNPVLWWLAGVFLGPYGLVWAAAFISPAPKPTTDAEGDADSPRLPPAESPSNEHPAPAAPTTTTVSVPRPGCGKQVNRQVGRCPYCRGELA